MLTIKTLGILMKFQPWGLIGLSMLLIALNGCGGGGSSSSSGNSSSDNSSIDDGLAVNNLTSGSFNSVATVSGIATYTNYSVSGSGIDYDSEQSKPIRGAVIKLLNATGTELASGNTASDGSYSLSGNVDGAARLLVLAELGLPGSVNTRVVDNTSNNALYTLFADIDVDNSNVTQNINAGSGWSGGSYTSTRSAGPFSILDVIYQAQQLMLSVDNSVDFPLLTVNWSTLNSSADGNISDGDIGTSFYLDNNLYILGRANADTDEYDKAVIAHEWGHYFEDTLSRSDSVGGRHGQGDILHPSVAWSEGFATALASMILDNPLYIDTFGLGQNVGDITNVEQDSNTDSAIFNGGANPLLDGYYSETSVMELLYDLFDGGSSDDDTVALGFAPIYEVLTDEIRTTKSFISLFSFLHFIKLESPANSELIDTLFSNENINVVNANEFDDRFDTALPPIYTMVAAGATVTRDSNAALLQTSNDYGFANSFDEGNKLLNQRFFKATAAAAACYTITAMPVASADLSLTFVDNININSVSGGFAESRDVNLTAGEIVSFNVGAFSNNARFSVSFLAGC
jgi:hypothetical protein